jgi:hypothetical protein
MKYAPGVVRKYFKGETAKISFAYIWSKINEMSRRKSGLVHSPPQTRPRFKNSNVKTILQ